MNKIYLQNILEFLLLLGFITFELTRWVIPEQWCFNFEFICISPLSGLFLTGLSLSASSTPPTYFRESQAWSLPQIGLIRVKEGGWTGFSKGWQWQSCTEGFPKGEAQGKSWGAAMPARGKPRPSRLFYFDLHLSKIQHFGDFLNFSNIYFWRIVMVAKLLEYVYFIIKVSIVFFLSLICT